MSVPRTLSKACQSPVTVRVRDFHPETHDTFTLTLVPPDGDDFRFQPGQFNMIYAFGVGEAAISLSGNPAYNASIVHTIRSVGSVTSALAKLRQEAQSAFAAHLVVLGRWMPHADRMSSSFPAASDWLLCGRSYCTSWSIAQSLTA